MSGQNNTSVHEHGEDAARWRRRPHDRPAEIASAAISVFSKKGFASATMDEIAEVAGVSKGTIYLYYRSKEELLVESVRERLVENQSKVLPILFQVDANVLTAEKVRWMLGEAFTRITDIARSPGMKDLTRVILAERSHSEKLRDMHRDLVRKGIGILTEYLKRASKAGVIKTVNPENLAKSILGHFLFFPVIAEITGSGISTVEGKREREEIVNFALRGLGL